MAEEEKPGETPLMTEAGETPAKAAAAPNAAELAAQLADALKQLKAVNRESAERRKALEAFEKAEAERKQSEMTEAQKLQAKIETLERERAEAQAAATAALVRAAVTAKATSRFFDVGDVYMALAGKLAPDAAGNIEGLDEALDDLAKAKPHWVKGKPAAGPFQHATAPANGTVSAGESAAERRKRLFG